MRSSFLVDIAAFFTKSAEIETYALSQIVVGLKLIIPMAKIRLRLDPWPPEYESSFQIEEFEQEAGAKIDTSVEGIGWEPVEAGEFVRPQQIFFVDGVRRIEARVIVDDDSGQIIRGLFG